MNAQLARIARAVIWLAVATMAISILAALSHGSPQTGYCPPGEACAVPRPRTSTPPPPRPPQPLLPWRRSTPQAQAGRAVKPFAGVVKLRITHADQQTTNHSTGIDLGDGWIATCGHVLRDRSTITAEWVDGTRRPARLIDSDAPHDAALLRVADPPDLPHCNRLANRQPVGTRVLVAGWGAPDDRFYIAQGTIARYEGDRVIVRARVREGMSGGPIYMSGGPVLGILSEAVKTPAGWEANGTTGAWLAAWLDSHLSPPKESKPADHPRPPAPPAHGSTAYRWAGPPTSPAVPPADDKPTDASAGGISLPRLNELLADLARHRNDRSRDSPAPADRADQGDPAASPPRESTGESIGESPSLADWIVPALFRWGLPALGISGGTAGLVWAGYRALRWWRHRRRSAPPAAPPAPEVVGGAVDFPRNPERDDTEARRFLRLAELEGRDPVHDALIGRFALDELAQLIDTNADAADWARRLQSELERRFNAMVPLKRTPTVKE